MLAALIEILLLGALAGTLGVWVLVRRLAFFTHATAAATFPGLIAASRWGIAPLGGAFAAAGAFSTLQRAITRRPGTDAGAVTGTLLVGALAVGAAIVPGEHHVDEGEGQAALFGALGTIGWGQVAVTAAALMLVGVTEARFRRAWTAAGFDPGSDDGGHADTALLVVAALTVVALADAVGALLAGVVLVAPAASARLLADDLPRIRRLAAAIAVAEGATAVVVADAAGVDAAAVFAVIAGVVHAAVAAIASVRRPAVAA